MSILLQMQGEHTVLSTALLQMQGHEQSGERPQRKLRFRKPWSRQSRECYWEKKRRGEAQCPERRVRKRTVAPPTSSEDRTHPPADANSSGCDSRHSPGTPMTRRQARKGRGGQERERNHIYHFLRSLADQYLCTNVCACMLASSSLYHTQIYTHLVNSLGSSVSATRTRAHARTRTHTHAHTHAHTLLANSPGSSVSCNPTAAAAVARLRPSGGYA